MITAFDTVKSFEIGQPVYSQDLSGQAMGGNG
jgi:hypothetical protein